AWAAPSGITFTDVTREAGIAFRHVHGGSGEKHYVETMGSGACWFDHDGDGDIDLFAVNSGRLPGYKGDADVSSRLYRNDGGGRFTDVTAQAGVSNEGRYGMGCVAGDIDGDRDRDLYVTNFGPNVLYRNEGGGRFKDVTAESGTGDPRWSTSAAFADVDNDGDLDLYVANYIDFTLENNKFCGERKPGHRAYCHPDEYNGVPDTLYRNRGDGRFEDVSAAAGVADPIGKGLGVVFLDVNDDGWQDIYVANDKTINFLYLNKADGSGSFQDISMTAGTGFSESGMPQAGMGTDAADVNGDGRQDLIVTNLDYETNQLYVNNGDRTFTDGTYRAGLGEVNFLNVGFGADFLDYDNDADQDLLIVNGHILDNIALFKEKLTYAQPRSLLANDGSGFFKEVGPSLGPAFAEPNVGRGLAVGDMDDDGDLDLFVLNNDRPAQLLRNDGGAQAGHWMLLVLRGSGANTDGIGARVRVIPRGAGPGRTQTLEVRAGSSYLSQNDVRLHAGLGPASSAEVEVRWPGGGTQTVTLDAGRIHTIEQKLPR
ncbi:MAG TPA: CRTAC1 family protein, partial [Candidatus Polarisedimenticolia bacterium]|nr:CRTAC1 family protein [Candidatus Polarisedimenticolia bacterium]